MALGWNCKSSDFSCSSLIVKRNWVENCVFIKMISTDFNTCADSWHGCVRKDLNGDNPKRLPGIHSQWYFKPFGAIIFAREDENWVY